MPTIGWTITLDEKSHTVELDHSWYLGQRTLRLDGNMIEHTAKVHHALLDRGSAHPFRIGKHACLVNIRSNWIGLFRYELLVDSQSLAPTTPVPPQAGMMVFTALVAVSLGLLGSILLLTVRVYLER